MRRFSVFLCTLVIFIGLVGAASATPVDFDVDGFNSSVLLSDNYDSWPLGSASITGSLVSGLGDEAFTLSDNETYELDFFTLNVTSSGWLAGGTYHIKATLAFSLPEITAAGSGGGLYGSVFGTIQGGTLRWDDSTLPDVFTVAGNEVSIDFEEGMAIGLGHMATVHAYVTNKGGADPAPVPEPATLLLLGAGLIGLAGYGRRRLLRKHTRGRIKLPAIPKI